MNIKGIDKALLLVNLYNNSKGLEPHTMNYYEASVLIKAQTRFDVLNYKPLYVDLGSDTVDTYKYNKYNGAGLAEVVTSILEDVF